MILGRRFNTSFRQVRSFCSQTAALPSPRLFVAGLSWAVDEKTLKDAFSTFGEVTEGFFF